MKMTIDIDDPILKEIKRLHRREGKSLGRIVSDLLAQALAAGRKTPKNEPEFRWIANPWGRASIQATSTRCSTRWTTCPDDQCRFRGGARLLRDAVGL